MWTSQPGLLNKEREGEGVLVNATRAAGLMYHEVSVTTKILSFYTQSYGFKSLPSGS